MAKFRNVAHPYVTQMSLKDKARHVVVSKSRFLCFIENGQGRTPVLFDRTPQGVKVIVDYSAEYDYPLAALADPPAILKALNLQDDSNQVFTKTCEVVSATWQAAAPAPTFDLVIATRKYGIGSTDSANAPIVWWKVAGQPKQEPTAPCNLTTPAIQKRLLAYELVDTRCTQFEVIRCYRKVDALQVARKAGATHKDRQGNFYYKDRATNLVYVGRVDNGSIDWQQDWHSHLPDTTERLS